MSITFLIKEECWKMELESGELDLGMIELLNGIAVGIYGMVLSVAFCNIIWTKGKYWILTGSMAGLLVLQGAMVIGVGADMVWKLYPVITHIPMVLIVYHFCKKRLWSVIAVLTAYLCCQLRRWISLLVLNVDASEFLTLDLVEIIITIPLLMLLIHFVAPSIRNISQHPVMVQVQFGLVSVLSYGFDYVTRVYTNMLSDGNPVIAEFMFFMCSVVYLMSMLHTSQQGRIRTELEQMQDYLNQQISQAVREIELMREAEQKGKIYRHDLRHHMQYLSECIENNRLEQAQNYIHGICKEIEASKVVSFCKNEAVNLTLSSFVRQAMEQGISIEIKAEIPRKITVFEGDLCVLFSNALENALHACQKRRAKGMSAAIEVVAFEKNEKLLLQIINTCEDDIVFKKGVPVSNEPGHGIGVQSICAIVERYQGVYHFSVREDRFTLQVSI